MSDELSTRDLFARAAARPGDILHVSIDMQIGRCMDGENRGAINRIAHQVAPEFHQAGIDTAWVYMTRGTAREFPRDAVIRDLMPEITVQEGDLLLPKNTPSAFRSEFFTRALEARGARTLLLSGFFAFGPRHGAPMRCVRETACDGAARGYDTILLTDCTNAMPKESYDLGLMREAGVRMATFAEIRELLPG